jgi:hypothetical protein
MVNTLAAIIDEAEQLELTEPIRLEGHHRALVTILDEPPAESPSR